jgi:CRISPR/Cas system-associated exonuclease Cas4 (RecB family)
VELLGEMRQYKVSVIPHRSHGQSARCAGCGYQAICEERLK